METSEKFLGEIYIYETDRGYHLYQRLYGSNPEITPPSFSRESRTLYGKISKKVIRESLINAINKEGHPHEYLYVQQNYPKFILFTETSQQIFLP